MLPNIVADRLREHRDRQIAERLRAGERWEDHDLIFPTRYGTPMHPENLSRSLHGLLARASLPRQRFHDLRHACASLLLAQGVSLKDVQETLGHTQISTTADLYGHMYEERRREIATRMNDFLQSPG
jgi:integrase